MTGRRRSLRMIYLVKKGLNKKFFLGFGSCCAWSWGVVMWYILEVD